MLRYATVRLDICVLNPIQMSVCFSFFQRNRFQSLVLDKTKVPRNRHTGDKENWHQNEDDHNEHCPVGVGDFLVSGLQKEYILMT